MWSVNVPNFIQVPPEIHRRWILAEPDQVPAEEHLAPLDLRCFLGQEIFLEFGFIGGCLGVEGARGDVVLKKFLIHQVDDSGDELLQVFGPAHEGFDVGCEGQNSFCFRHPRLDPVTYRNSNRGRSADT